MSLYGLMVKRVTSNDEIHGSIPCGGNFFFFFPVLLFTRGSWDGGQQGGEKMGYQGVSSQNNPL